MLDNWTGYLLRMLGTCWANVKMFACQQCLWLTGGIKTRGIRFVRLKIAGPLEIVWVVRVLDELIRIAVSGCADSPRTGTEGGHWKLQLPGARMRFFKSPCTIHAAGIQVVHWEALTWITGGGGERRVQVPLACGHNSLRGEAEETYSCLCLRRDLESVLGFGGRGGTGQWKDKMPSYRERHLLLWVTF